MEAEAQTMNRGLFASKCFCVVFIAVHFEKSKTVQDFGQGDTPLIAVILQQRCIYFTCQPASFRIEERATNYEQTQ
jgi:hypothetical protein